MHAVDALRQAARHAGPGLAPGREFIPTRDRSLVGAWIALEDATVENGCLRVIPRSHRTGYIWPTRQHQNPEEFDPTESQGFDERDEVVAEVRAGSALFFNGYLLHRSKRNRGPPPASAGQPLLNAWSLLPWAIPPVSVTSTKISTFDCRRVSCRSGRTRTPTRATKDDPDWVFLRPRDVPSEPRAWSPDHEEG